MIVYREIYCRDCNRIIGRYNAKYYTEARVGEVINTCHAGHVKLGHVVEQRHIVSGRSAAPAAASPAAASPATASPAAASPAAASPAAGRRPRRSP